MCQGQDSWTQFYSPNIRYNFLLCLQYLPGKICQTVSGKSQMAGATSGFAGESEEAEGHKGAGCPSLPAGRKAEICLTELGILYTEIHAVRDFIQVKRERHGPLGTAQE